jgi:hypothetical protein
MTNTEFNTKYLTKLEASGVLAPGSAQHFVQTGEVRRELSKSPAEYIGELTSFLLSDEGRSYLSEEGERSMARGGGLARVMPLLQPLLHGHHGPAFVAEVGGEMQAWEPRSAATAMVRKLTADPGNRKAVSPDFRPDPPPGEARVAAILSKLASGYGVRVSDSAALAAEWYKLGQTMTREHELARTIMTRLAGHERHRLARGSAEVPNYDPEFWGEYAARQRESADAEVRRLHAGYL